MRVQPKKLPASSLRFGPLTFLESGGAAGPDPLHGATTRLLHMPGSEVGQVTAYEA
ncbi:hypothetical protein EV578_11597 [Streptomyces sp. BK205]|nr:hypothetical protein EV578_11597 [Streptomyces sp. BK205]